MSTRCLTRVFEGDQEVCCIYRHHDGYPDGHGKELADFVATKRIVNGYSSRSTLRRVAMANGAGRLAAQIVTFFEENDPDIMPPGTKDIWEDYEYHVKCPTADQARDKDDGLPIVVEGFSVLGGHGDKPRSLERVTIPDDDVPTDTSPGTKEGGNG